MADSSSAVRRRHKRRRAEIRTLRTLWNPIRISDTRSIRPSTAWALTLGLYGVGWLVPVISAVVILATPADALDMPPLTLGRVVSTLVPSLALVVTGCGVLGVIATATSTPRAELGLERPRTGRWYSSILIYVMALYAFLFNGIITHYLELIPGASAERDYPWSEAPDDGVAVMRVLDSMIGGASEELIVLALPIVALRAARLPWRVIVPVATLLRVAFHVYYGPIALPGLAVWALIMVALYAWCGRVWPLFFAHATNNGVVALIAVLAERNQSAADLVSNLWFLAYLLILAAGSFLWLSLLASLHVARKHRRRTLVPVQRPTH